MLVRLPAAKDAEGAAKAARIQLLGLLRRDDTNLVIFLDIVLPTGVVDGVDMQLGSGRLAAELAESLDELLLDLVCDIVLLTEEDDATLGDCACWVSRYPGICSFRTGVEAYW